MNDALKIENNDIMNKFQKTENILNDVPNIIEVSQKEAYRAVNTILSQRKSSRNKMEVYQWKRKI